jgi:hypothetical protein
LVSQVEMLKVVNWTATLFSRRIEKDLN